MQLTQKWLNDTLAKNPALSIQVQGGKDCAKVSKPKEPNVTHPKYGNHKVYAYKDGFVAGNKDAKEHGNIVDVFDSTKEYCRWLDLQILEKGGSITELKRQVPLTIQEAFQYEGKEFRKSTTEQISIIEIKWHGRGRGCKGIRPKERQVHSNRSFSPKVETTQIKVSGLSFRVVLRSIKWLGY